MSRVNVNDLTMERNLDSRESAVVGGARVAVRFGGSSYPYAYPYGCEPNYGYNYGYDYGYYSYPQFNFGFGDFGRHGHDDHYRGRRGHDDDHRRDRDGGYHGHH